MPPYLEDGGRLLVVSLSDLVELVEFDIKRKQSRLATEL
jgi:hypothetical protein